MFVAIDKICHSRKLRNGGMLCYIRFISASLPDINKRNVKIKLLSNFEGIFDCILNKMSNFAARFE